VIPSLPARYAVFAIVAAVLTASADAREPGRFASPSRGTTVTGGALVDARWIVDAEEAAGADEAELVLSLDGGRTFPVRISAGLSPGETSYRWRVPALPTEDARLALRIGVDGEREHERLVVVSDVFAISAGAADASGLVRGTLEWWTEQALTEPTVGDLLETSLEPAGENLVAPSGESEADQHEPIALLSLDSSRAPGNDRGSVVGPMDTGFVGATGSAPRPMRV